MITRQDIEAAQARIQPYLRETPVLEIGGDAFGSAGPVSLKLELLQHTGSFKPRGAFNSLLSREIPESGVVAASGGNHGAAVAYAARELGIPVKVFVPRYAAATKIDRVRGFGAEVEVVGERFAETQAAAIEYAGATGAIPIHPYDDIETVTGQGTLGREIERQMPDLDVLLVSVGGGGLIGGICAWYDGRIRIVAVETEGTAALAKAMAGGGPRDIEVSGIAADALGAPSLGAIAYDIVRGSIEPPVLVSDADVVEAQRRLWGAARLVAEPGGATALAALTAGKYTPAKSSRVGVLICGGNASPNWFIGG